MKDSKEKEHRISNLKNMLDNISENDEYAQDSFEEANIYKEFEDASDDDYEIVDAEEMINTLSKDYNKYPKEELKLDKEFIFKPNIDSNIIDETSDDNEIDEDFIIKTKLEDSEFPNEDSRIFEFENEPDYSYEDDDFVSEKFDSLLNKKIAGHSIFAIGGLVLGIIFILISLFLFSASTQRIIDNVSSGEVNTSAVGFILVGIFLIIISVYKLKAINTPFGGVVDSIKNVENDKEPDFKEDSKKEDVAEPKPLANDNKEVKKIGEFDISEFKNKIEKSTPELDGVTHITEKRTDVKIETPSETEIQTSDAEEDITDERIEEIEYEKALLDNESIDDIFADMEDIEEVPIISIDSKDK
ncbi:MAG: topoisomerase IV [Methanobrevibacter sp.]|uniref:topoisomerase IV n=1 Tax=Methanobrevibacter sp. TaxID=66852 RepID=UPI0026E0FB5A|nr:topoisomerase IV [Methanobrevibacter sp.]MDO5848625.1 topoisomerase IV [Methanobrevibacter sp.]